MFQVYPNYQLLSEAAAKLFIEEAKAAVTAKGVFYVALSGGQTPSRCYELLAGEPYRSQVAWQKVHFFWGDERFVAPGDARRNEEMARKTFLSALAISSSQIHPIPYGQDLEKAAGDYEQLLSEFFMCEDMGFDLVLLGLGSDGHTASLFPATGAIYQRRRVVPVPVAVAGMQRISLSPQFINKAKTVAFIVEGASKAPALSQVFSPQVDAFKLPAKAIHPVRGKLLWLVDEEAFRHMDVLAQNKARESEQGNS